MGFLPKNDKVLPASFVVFDENSAEKIPLAGQLWRRNSRMAFYVFFCCFLDVTKDLVLEAKTIHFSSPWGELCSTFLCWGTILVRKWQITISCSCYPSTHSPRLHRLHSKVKVIGILPDCPAWKACTPVVDPRTHLEGPIKQKLASFII